MIFDKFYFKLNTWEYKRTICSWRMLFILCSFITVLLLYENNVIIYWKNGISSHNNNQRRTLRFVSACETYLISDYKTLSDLGFESIDANLSQEYIDTLQRNVLSSSPDDFGRLLERARAFRNGFERLEAFHTMKSGKVIGFSRTPNLSGTVAVSDFKKFIGVIDNLEKNLFPFLYGHYRQALDLKYSFSGRGIVFAVGNSHVSMICANIKLLRFLGCDLPIEIFYNGEDDLSFNNREILKQFSFVETRDIQQLINDTSVKMFGWALKPFALLFSSFLEVILMDADTIFLQNPSTLFNHPEYQRARALFYYDRTLFGRHDSNIEWLSNLFPKPWNKRLTHSNRIFMGVSHNNQDAGVVVIDKFARFPGLLLTSKLNSINERDSVTYIRFHGDKESFWLAQEMMDYDYAFDSQLIGTMGIAEDATNFETNVSTVCSTQMVHFDQQGKVLWFNQFVFLNKSIRPLQLLNFQHYVQEPGVYVGQPVNVYCLSINGPASNLSSHETALIAEIGKYWNEANMLVSP